MKISKRADGRFGTQIRTPDGTYKTVYGKTSKECRQKAYDLVAQIEAGTYVKSNKTLFSQWAKDWEKSYLVGIKGSTKLSYQNHIKNHIKPEFGNTPIQSIEKKDVQAFFTKLLNEKELSPKTIKNIHGTLHKCFDDAITAGLIKTNPSNDATLPKRSKPEIYPLSETDVPVFLSAAKTDKYDNTYKFLLLTGLRACELTGLTYDRIDFNNNRMLIDRQLHSVCPVTFTPPKHDKIRTVPLPQNAIDIIKLQRIEQAKLKLMTGMQNYNPYGFVFTEGDGRPYRAKTVLAHLKAVASRAGFPKLRLHDLRHTYAVLSLQAGVDIKTVQENLGHHSAAFTLDQYAFVTDGMLQSAADKIDNIYMSISMSKE
jgi:integrase